MEDLLGSTLIVAFGAVVAGGLVHGTLGIGFPMVATPLIALATDVKTAILLTLAPTLAVNVISIIHGGQWQHSLARHWPIAVFMLAGSIFGTWMLLYTEPIIFKPVLAAIILLYLYTTSVKGTGWHWIRRNPRIAGATFGILGGVTAGTVNVAVPVLIIYFSELQLAPLALIQILNLCFLAGKVAQVGTFAVSGHLAWSMLLLAVPMAVLACLTLYAGFNIRKRVDAATYARWLRRMLLFIAGVLVVQFVRHTTS